jgi:hypothetical protein
VSASNVSEDWDEQSYWDRFEQDLKVKQWVCRDPLCGARYCGCEDDERGDFGPVPTPWEVLDREEGLLDRALSALRRKVRAPQSL